jgi:hypothetical protein
MLYSISVPEPIIPGPKAAIFEENNHTWNVCCQAGGLIFLDKKGNKKLRRKKKICQVYQ